LRYLIVGFGSIGKRHFDNLRNLEPDAEITVWHTRRSPGETVSQDINSVRTVYCFMDAINPRPDVALITTPAPNHVCVAQDLAREGIDLFIEKPLSSEMSGIDKLLEIQKRTKILIMVGYNLRFHPSLHILKESAGRGDIGRIISVRAEVGQYLPEWRPGTDYRNSVSARKELGGGVFLELSHELDYVRWIAGEITSVMAQADHVSDLELGVEDTAEIILRFVNGAIGNVHLDMVQRSATRSCKLIGTDGVITWDGIGDSVRLYSARSGVWSDLHIPQGIPRNQMYLEELQHFISCIRERREPLVTALDGKRVLEITLAALQSSREQRCISV